jgi:putative transposase
LEINRASIYYKPSGNDDIWLLNVIRDIWLQHTFFGYRKIAAFLGTEHNIFVNKKRIQRLMQIAEISAVYPKPNLSQANKEHRVHPYLLRNLEINNANLVWMTDITYLKLNGRFVYLVALIDVFSRYIVGWHLSVDLDTDNCLLALAIALKNNKPEIINSDQGSQFTSDIWISTLLAHGIKISMDGVRRCIDNIYIERFWRTIKYEAIYLNEYTCYNDLYSGIKNYIEFYNNRRPHQSLDYKTPVMMYNYLDI